MVKLFLAIPFIIDRIQSFFIERVLKYVALTFIFDHHQAILKVLRICQLEIMCQYRKVRLYTPQKQI